MPICAGKMGRLIQDELLKARDYALLAENDRNDDRKRILLSIARDELSHAKQLMVLNTGAISPGIDAVEAQGEPVMGYQLLFLSRHGATAQNKGGDNHGLHRLFCRVPEFSTGVVLG